jgi:hypothetical protein
MADLGLLHEFVSFSIFKYMNERGLNARLSLYSTIISFQIDTAIEVMEYSVY